MSETNAFKLLEVGVLLAAGVAFGWWQLRDVAKARQASRAAAEQAQRQASEQAAKQHASGPEKALNNQAGDRTPNHPGATPGPQHDT